MQLEHTGGAARRLPLVLILAGAPYVLGCGGSERAEPAPEDSPASFIADATETPAPNDVEPETTLEVSDAAVAPESEVAVALADEEKVQQALRDTGGKVLVVNVWATWCLPCIAEMPVLSDFYQDMDPERVAFLSLSADQAYTLEDAVRPFAKERKLPFPVHVMDFADPDPELLAATLGVAETGWDGALPATFVLDRDRKLVRHWFEEVKPGELEAAVESLHEGVAEP